MLNEVYPGRAGLTMSNVGFTLPPFMNLLQMTTSRRAVPDSTPGCDTRPAP